MRAPDGGYEDGFTIPGSGESPPRAGEGKGARDLETNNPLSLHDEVRTPLWLVVFWVMCGGGR